LLSYYRLLKSVLVLASTTPLAVLFTTALGLYNDGFYRPVPAGVMVSSGDYYATTSYVVEDTSTGKRYLLVVYHLFEANSSLDAYQPTPYSDYYYIGSAIRASTYADGALVEANKELAVKWDPRVRLPDGSYVVLADKAPYYGLQDYVGDTVYLVGVTTGYSWGVIRYYREPLKYIDSSTNITREIRFVVFLHDCITSGGDSGAPVWIPSWSGNKLVGHVIGCWEYADLNRTVIVSVTSVESYLLVEPVLGG